MGLNGLEPSTSRLSGVRSNQLSYRPVITKSKRVTRIELATTAWKAVVLPLNYTRMAVWTGLEPATSCVTGRHSNQLNYQTIWWILLFDFCCQRLSLIQQLREQDLNLRPSGYEPDELPNCSIPR